MTERAVFPRVMFLTAALTAVISLAVTSASAATLSSVTTATGSAYGIKGSGAITAATLALVPINIPETPTVATTNSALASTKTVASVYVPTLCAFFTPTCAVNAHALKVSTKNVAGATGSSVASSDVKDASLLFDLINVKVLHAECKADKAGLTMTSSLVVAPSTPTLPVAVPLPTSPAQAPNTIIPIGSGTTVVGTVILNEQIDTSNPTRNSGEVNAIHIKIPAGSPLSATGLDLIVGHAACSATGPAATA
ncbi:MAG: choice-of-anchor P family protein [Acidimicrobiales bacterium]